MEREIRRINFIGAPNVGKSTIAHFIFSQLKMKHYDCEFVEEYVKKWVYEGKEKDKFDEYYLLAKQMRSENIFLCNDVEIVVNECPILLCPIYAYYYHGEKFAKSLFKIASQFEKEYPSINVLLKRTDKPYNPKGRYNSEQESNTLDALFEKILFDFSAKDSIIVSDCDKQQEILEEIEKRICGK